MIANCLTCGSVIVGRRRGAKYCSQPCEREYFRSRKLRPNWGLTSATQGALSELTAATDLMRRGYNVFRALSPSCPCDLIAFNGTEHWLVEVRTGQASVETGIVYLNITDKDRGRFTLLAAVMADGYVMYFPTIHDEEYRYALAPTQLERLVQWGVVSAEA